MRALALATCLLGLISGTATAMQLHAAETRSFPVSFSDPAAPGEPLSCGISTAIRAVTDSETDLQTMIETQVILTLTDNGRGIGAELRVRVVRHDVYEGKVRIVGAPRVLEAELSSDDEAFVASLGRNAVRNNDGFYADWIDPGDANALMVPFMEAGASRRLKFLDSLSSKGAEHVSYVLSISHEDMQRHFECVNSLIERGKKMGANAP